MELFDFVSGYIMITQLTDIIDIGLVATLIYMILTKIKGTSAERLLKGVAMLLVAMLISSVFKLNSINYILEQLTQVGLIALVIVFQPELRKILERIGKATFYKSEFDEEMTDEEVVITSIVEACVRLSKEKEGALIVFERNDNIAEIIASGVRLNAKVTSELIRNVFYPKAPMHDGAMVIRDGQITAAACILPLSQNQSISKDLGTRHRAAVGMTESTDSLCVVVSEETGSISVSSKGMLKRHLSKATLTKLLMFELTSEKENEAKKHKFVFLNLFMKKHKEGKED